MEETKTIRKCFICKNEMALEDGNFVYDGKKYFNKSCFIEKKTKKITIEEVEILIINLKEEHKYFLAEVICKHHFYMWLHEAYDITLIPRYFFQKMAGVMNGTWEGISKPVPIEHIFDMWKRKKKKLDKINSRKKRIGEAIEGSNRLNYDLAVLLGKYDGYLKWREKQKMLSYNRQLKLEERRDAISYKKIARNRVIEKDDISDILESI